MQLKNANPISAQGFVKVQSGKAQLWHVDGSPSTVIAFNTILPYVSESGDFLCVCSPDGEALVMKRDVEVAPSIHQFNKLPLLSLLTKGLTFWISHTFGAGCLRMVMTVPVSLTIC